MPMSNGSQSLRIPQKDRPPHQEYKLGLRVVSGGHSTPSSELPRQPVPSPALENLALLGEDDAVLLQRVVESQARYEDRKAALEELCSREADGLDQLVLDELSRVESESRWRNCLVLVLARVPMIAPEHRARLTPLLLREARRLRDASEADADAPLWAAVRTFGALAPVDQLHELLEFLRPEDSGTTRQVAFQAIYSMLEMEPAPATPQAAALRERVSQLAAKYLDPDLLTSAENTALAVTCFCAAVLAGAVNAMALADTLVALGRPRMVRRCTTLLEGARQARGQRGMDVRDLDDVLGRLTSRSSAGG
jgi:hypothetical protein